MATRQWILCLLTGALLSLLAGCSSGNTSNVQNPPPPPPAEVSIAFQPSPPGSVSVGSNADLTAVVSNDTSNAGVDWNLTCQSGNCGTLAPPHTASGQPVLYTPPSALAGNSQVVNIAGFATADHTKNVLASISVNAFGSILSGTYVLQAQGSESSAPYQFAGVMVLDGNGNITSGKQTFNFLDPNSGSFTSSTGPIVPAGSSYFLGPDGRGTLTINPSNPGNNPSIGPETFNLVFLSSDHLLITAAPTSALDVTASGTMDLQAANITAPTAGYAIALSGADFNGLGPTAIGGVLNIDNQFNNPNNISGKGSVADQSLTGTMTEESHLSGIISVPDQFGGITLSLNLPAFSMPTMQFAGYIVDATNMVLIETDNGGAGTVAGIAIAQGAATGTFLDDTAFSSPYVFGVLGVDEANGSPSTMASAGTVTPDGAGHLTNGFSDTVFQTLASPTTGLPAQISGTFAGTYSVLPAGTGRVHAFFGGFASPDSLFQPTYIVYLTGNGNPALVLASMNLNFPFLGTGLAYPQASTPLTFSGNYGLGFTQQNGNELDGTAVMTVAPPSISGVADVGTNLDQTFIGTVASQGCVPAVVGCFQGSFSNSNNSGAWQGSNSANPNAPIAFSADFYMINSAQGFFVENDLLQQSQAQVSFGYFVTSTSPQQAAAKKSSKQGANQAPRTR